MKNDVNRVALTEPTINDCLEADTTNHDNKGIDGRILEDTMVWYHEVSYRSAACEDLPSPNIADWYEPNTAVNEPEITAELLLNKEKASLLEAEEDATDGAGVFGLPTVAEMYTWGFGKP